jgi:hypothetical protein
MSPEKAPVIHFSHRGTLMANVTELHVNGARRRINTDGERPFLSVLRDDLPLEP